MIDLLGPDLIARGFLVIPIKPNAKRPALNAWQKARLTAADCAQWRGHGVGLLCGVGPWPLVAVDIDSTDESYALWCEAHALDTLGPAPVRVGAAPKRLLLYRAVEPGWSKLTGPLFEDIYDARHRVEVLGAGQQFVAFGRHPDTGGQYEWIDVWGGVETLSGGELTAVELSALRLYLDGCAKEAARRGMMRIAAQPGTGSNTHSSTEVGRGVAGEGARRDPLETYSPPLGLSIDDARQLLKFAGDASDYDAWLTLGMALHHEFHGGDYESDAFGFGLWDEWSSTAANYAGVDDLVRRWEGFGRSVAAGGRAVTLKYLVKRASEASGAAVAARIEAESGEGSSGTAGGAESATRSELRAKLEDFQAYLPDHKYLYTPTGALWPSESVNVSVAWPDGWDGKPTAPNKWLDKWRPVVQMTWAPGEPQIIEGRLVSDGGWAKHDGVRVFNQYRPPTVLSGDSRAAGRWRDHLRSLYPGKGEDGIGEADHIERWFAQRAQQPQVKLNHALVLGGGQGIGKDSICEPLKHAVGPWNWSEISPSMMVSSFTGYRKAVVVRVSEIHDLGETNRFAFYEATKTLASAPPDTISVNEKHTKEYQILNVLGLLMTTNHKLDGIYLPPDDRRHFVAWSDLDKSAIDDAFWPRFWAWLSDEGGIGAVVGFLRGVSLAGWDAKAPPPKTEAWHQIVGVSTSPEVAELDDAIDALGRPVLLTLDQLREAEAMSTRSSLASELSDVRKRRQWVHKMELAGYSPLRNTTARDGLWSIAGKRQVVYGRKDASVAQKTALVEQIMVEAVAVLSKLGK